MAGSPRFSPLPFPAASEVSGPASQPVPASSRGLWLAVWSPLFETAQGQDQTQTQLEALAAWSHCLTPTVSLHGGEGLLLEVGGSLRFFSGLERIKQLLKRQLDNHGLECNLSTASIPLAALWLARAGSIDVPAHAELPRFLRALSVSATGWPEPVQQRLREMGIATVGECMRLPRAGFARRFGKRCLDDLDRATGRLPEPQRVYAAPRSLRWSKSFETELVDRQILAAAVRSGIESLACDLRTYQAETREVEIGLRHLQGPDTRESVQFVEPVYLQARLLAPLLVRLETMQLARSVIGLSLETGNLEPMRCIASCLLTDIEDSPATGISPFTLIECLRMRLGIDAVCGIELLAEHRPERAWGRLADARVGTRSSRIPTSPWAEERPLWLLPRPQPLSGSAPYPVAGPERIESGWWDGMDVRRDYYIMVTGNGARWWVFRECDTNQWYLHGFFG